MIDQFKKHDEDQPITVPVAWELRTGKTDKVLIEITNNYNRACDWAAIGEIVVPLYRRKETLS